MSENQKTAAESTAIKDNGGYYGANNVEDALQEAGREVRKLDAAYDRAFLLMGA